MSDLNPVADVPGDCFTCVFLNEVPSAVHHQRWGDVAQIALSSVSLIYPAPDRRPPTAAALEDSSCLSLSMAIRFS